MEHSDAPRRARATRVGLAFFLAVYWVPTLLAGLDILGGTEPDLSSEWIIVAIYFSATLLLTAASLVEWVRGRERESPHPAPAEPVS